MWVFVAIFKIVDKSWIWGSGCSGRRGAVIGGGKIWWKRERDVMGLNFDDNFVGREV